MRAYTRQALERAQTLVQHATAPTIHERELQARLDHIREWAEENLAVAICEDYQPGDETTTDSLISARALIRMCGQEPT